MKIKEITKLFKTKKVNIKMKREYINNPMIIHLPSGVGSMADDFEFSKIKVDYHDIGGQIVFSVCIDDFLFINDQYKLIDDESKKAYFGQVAKLKNNKEKAYSSLDARAVTVIAAVIEGKIKLDESCK